MKNHKSICKIMRQFSVWVLLLTICYNSYAQQAQLKILQDLGGMNTDKMSYCYKVLLTNKQSGMVLDSVSGMLYRNKMYYLDSNRLVMNIRDADYTLQINPQSKTAYVKSVKVIETKMKGKAAVPNVLFDVNELQKKNISSFRAGKDKDGNMIVNVVFDAPDIDEIEAVITADKKLVKLVVKIPGGGVGKDAEQRVLSMYDFSDQFDPALISTARFMTINKDTYKLKGKFAACTVQRLI